MPEFWTDFTAQFQDPWIVHGAFVALVLYPLWRSFRRAGVTPYWSLLVVVPLIGFTATLLVLATRHWPAVPPLARRRRH
ncbi:MAG: hypothetical protein RLO50_07815 [Azospirillaceae bacterium]